MWERGGGSLSIEKAVKHVKIHLTFHLVSFATGQGPTPDLDVYLAQEPVK